MRKNKLALGGLAVCIFGMGVSTGIMMTKYVLQKRGVAL